MSTAPHFTFNLFCSLQILVRVHQQFEHFLSKEQSVDHQVLMAVLKTLAKIGPNADPVFRDECKSIITQLGKQTN